MITLVSISKEPYRRDREYYKKRFEDSIIIKLGGQVKGEYKGINIPVDCICKNGHLCKPAPNNIQRGKGMCKICVGRDFKTAEKNFFQNIKNQEGCIKGEYRGKDIPVDCICKNGHFCKPTPNTIHQGGRMCRVCSGKDFETAKINFYQAIKNLEGIVKGEYKGSNTPVNCECKNGHPCSLIPNNIQQGNGMCKICANRDQKTSKVNFFQNIEAQEGQVKGEYKTSSEPVDCICKNGHLCKPAPSSIQQGQGMCRQCCDSKGYSQAQIDWLNSISNRSNVYIQHAENKGEVKIEGKKVDGYNSESKTIYEFHGDFWHGNPKFHDHVEIHPVSKKTFGFLFKATVHKEMMLKRLGYKYVCIWEHEWNLIKRKEVKSIRI